MNPTETQALLYGLLGGIISVAGTAIAIANWLNNRFDALKTRQQEAETRLQLEIEKLKGNDELSSSREISHWDLLEYKTNANRELIEHRTKRFVDELKALEARLSGDITDIKGFLEKTTEYQVRASRVGEL